MKLEVLKCPCCGFNLEKPIKKCPMCRTYFQIEGGEERTEKSDVELFLEGLDTDYWEDDKL